MEFLLWHYTKGLDWYLKRWVFYVRYVFHFFSLETLVVSLFAPWKRLVDIDKSAGFNLQKYFETLTFNLISRFIGAAVRIILFIAGLFIVLLTFFGGMAGVLVWMVIPLFGLSPYMRYSQRPENYLDKLMYKTRKGGGKVINTILDSTAGEFLTTHIGVSKQDLLGNYQLDDQAISSVHPKSLLSLFKTLFNKKAWSLEFLRKNEIEKDDFLLAAKWWDDHQKAKSDIVGTDVFGRPGIGLELLYGYTPTLNQFSVDLSTPQSYSHRLIGREPVVSQMERALTTRSSVVLIGEPGVGKKTVVLEFAHRAMGGQLGREMTYRRILEFDANALLSGSMDLNLKKNQIALVLAEAAYAGNIILMIRDIHRLTNMEVEGYDFTDVFEEYMEGKELKIIAVATPRDYERYIARNLRLRKFLREVTVTPPTKEEALEILIEGATNWEYKAGVVIPVPVLRKILIESDRYITEVPYPEKALELLDHAVNYSQQKGKAIVTVDDLNVVLSEKLGVSFTHLTGEEKKRLGNLEEIIHKRLINQDAAVDLIAKSLRGRSVGVKKENRPVGSFLFMGPTGVGKTETAKVLANVYYGSDEEIVRFDMAEYSGSEGLERLIGSVAKNLPGRLTTAIKNKPASLLLIDEIEKAKSKIYNLFLALLDEGEITDAFGRKINCQHLFVIATSNAGAEHIRQLVSQGVKGEELQKDVVNHVLEKQIYSPEFLNRFDGVIVYEPLNEENLVRIAHLMLSDLVENLNQKNIYLEVTEDVAKKIAREGHDPAFGARPMRRIIELVLGDLLGKAVLKDEIKPGDKIKIVAKDGKDEYGWESSG